MKNSEIRAAVRKGLLRMPGPVMGILLLVLAAGAARTGTAVGLARAVAGGTDTLAGLAASVAVEMGFLLLLAPLYLGITRELVGAMHGDAPSARQALRWFGDGAKRRRAYKLMGQILKRAALYWLAAYALIFLLVLVQHRGQLPSGAFWNLQGQAFSAGEKAARLLILLFMLPRLPALFFQAADPERTPRESIMESRAVMYPAYRKGARLLAGIYVQLGLLCMAMAAIGRYAGLFALLGEWGTAILAVAIVEPLFVFYAAGSLMVLVNDQLEQQGRTLEIMD